MLYSHYLRIALLRRKDLNITTASKVKAKLNLKKCLQQVDQKQNKDKEL